MSGATNASQYGEEIRDGHNQVPTADAFVTFFLLSEVHSAT